MAKRARLKERCAPEGVKQDIQRALKIHRGQVVDAVNEEAKAKLQEMFGQVDSLSDPQAQIIRFFDAIWQGMPSVESAAYFLHLDADTFAVFRAENAETDRLIKDFEGRVALEQYRKVCRDGTPREALEWLRANRRGLWQERKSLTVEDLRQAVAGMPDGDVIAIAKADGP